MTLRDLRDRLNGLGEEELNQKARYVESYDDFIISPLSMQRAKEYIPDEYEDENDLTIKKGEWLFC
jgi:hypothetical protein